MSHHTTRTTRTGLASRWASGVALAATMALGTVSVAVPATAAPSSASAVATAERPVAVTKGVTMTSRIVGTTEKGERVRGTFTPLKFVERNGTLKVRGVLDGVVRKANGTKQTFTAIRTLSVQSVNGTSLQDGLPAGAIGQRATCDVLNLVLGPLDLDLLGLEIHLDRVVLDVVARSGAGKLLGNLLCAITGLLDGGPLGGLLGQLSTLLNQLLARLGLGI